MSKKRRRKKKKTDREKVLEKMLQCSTECADLGTFDSKEWDTGIERIDYYVESLPMINFVKEQLVNYIFSNGMTAGGVSEDEVFHGFLYRNNEQNISNYAVLRDAVGLASLYGECGVRWLDGNIYVAKSGTYAPIVGTVDGVSEVYAYVTSKDGLPLGSKVIELSKHDTLAEVIESIERQDLILLDRSDFVNLRNDTSSLYGESPLLKDSLRLDLLVTAYERLNYDLKYDGPGRLLLRPRTGYVSGDDNDISTVEIMNQSMGAKNSRRKRAEQEITKVGEAIKESSSDSVILLSDAFDEKITKLDRVTKATEFLEWIKDKEGEMIASVMGLPPSLLEQGDLSGNVSMTRIIDNAMTNTIISKREHYATQLSPMISGKLGLSKIYFSKYTLQSEDSEEQKRLKVTTAIQQLAYSLEKYDSEEVRKVIDSMAEMLDYNLHDSVGGVVEL